MIHLHVHSEEGSFLDSTARVVELAKKAKQLGMSKLAITEHGYTSSIVNFYKACKKEGVDPILGCEVYITDDMEVQDPNDRYNHLILIAKNNVGYRNLQTLVSLGHTKGFYYKPRIDKKVLKQLSEGLICLSACLGGEIPRAIIDKNNSLAEKLVLEYKEMFGNDFYLEIQGADSPEQKYANEQLIKLSHKLDVPLVATSDIHFVEKEDYEFHGKFVKTSKNYDSNELYKDCWMKSEYEMFEVFEKQKLDYGAIMEAMVNTHIIADKCNVELEMGKSYLPIFPIPAPFKDQDSYLRHKINLGFKKRGLDKLPKDELQEYIDRAYDEFQVITKKVYSGYFLIVADFLEDCRIEGIYVGDGRGSADNSLICYLLEITNVDPIKYELNFGRFLTMDRKELPDIDLDIQSSKKAQAVNILRRKYGFDNVAQICTFTRFQKNNTIDSVGKVFNVPFAVCEQIKKKIPDGMSIAEGIQSGKVADFYEKYPEFFDIASRIEGLTKNISVHAGGVVICPSDRQMSDFTALALGSSGEVITQLEMHNVEEVGLVKIDCLATVTLDVIDDSMFRVGQQWDYLDVSDLDFNDEKTWSLIQRGATDGVFQLESLGMKDTCMRVKPESMEDLIAILALYRPDTMAELEHYIRRKHGQEEVTYLHPDLEPILSPTYGCILYQEQIMAITKVFAGYNDVEADKFRKGIGKKIPELVKALAEDFREKALAKGYSEEVVTALFEILVKMGGYCFNKGHATGYAITSYKTAYLKANHPADFMASLMSHQKKDTGQTNYEKVGMYIVKCQEMKFKVINPHINKSEPDFSVDEDGHILYGFNLIKGVGGNAIETILFNRPFNSFEHFLEVSEGASELNKTVIIALIKSGAFDCFGRERRELLEFYRDYRFKNGMETIKPVKSVNKTHIDKLLIAGYVTRQEATDKELCLQRWNYWRSLEFNREWELNVTAGDEFSWEFDTINYHLIGNPFANVEITPWEEYEEDCGETKIGGTVIAIKKNKIKKGRQAGKEMAFLQVESTEGMREVVCFADAWEQHRDKLSKGSTVIIRGKKQGEKLLCNGVKTLEQYMEDGN